MQLPPHNNVMNYSSVAKPKAQTEYAISSQNLSASKLTEAKATKLLERYLYNGCGKSYLGWKFAEYEIEADDTEVLIGSGGCRVWQFENDEPPQWWKRQRNQDKHFLDYVEPLWLHLKKCFRGLVVDNQTTHVPLIAVDPDRHTGLPTEEFITWVQIVADIFEAETPDFRISAEVNSANGSTKFFAWPVNGEPIQLEQAKEIACRIHDRIEQESGKKVEVFPHNMPNLRLPLHPEKSTIIDSGLLGTAIRRKGREKQKFETHSVVEFINWLASGENYDRQCLLRVVQESCANLPDEPVPANAPKEFAPENSESASQCKSPRRTRSARPPADSGRSPEYQELATPLSIRKLQEESNSWNRQRDALLIACRKAKRVLENEEALDFIHQHKLYTGEWGQNEERRRRRVEDILKIIGKTFDPKKCSTGSRFEFDVTKYRLFTQQHLPDRIKHIERKGLVRETGEIHHYSRYVIATNEDIACWMAINEFCRTTSLQDDGGVPEDRAEKIWEAIHRAGKVKHKWCVKRWRLIRDHLHERKIVICDYESDRNKAYCYQPGQFHPGVKAKRRRNGIPGSYRDITQKQRTKRPNTEGGYPVLANDFSGRNSDLDLFSVMQRGPPRSVSMNS